MRHEPSKSSEASEVTRALAEVRPEDPTTATRLLELVYSPLLDLARAYWRRLPEGNTLQPTALVHEVCLRMLGKVDFQWQDRAHFFAVCATAMRGILTDHARRRGAEKRGGLQRRVTLSHAVSMSTSQGRETDVLDLDEALAELGALSERQARIVECRLFSGMTIPEIAHALGVSERTIDRDWAMARAWMSARLSRTD